MTRLDVESLGKVLATPQVSGSLRALPTISFALDYWRGGGADPAVFKTTNIVIHALATFVLAWFFRSEEHTSELQPLMSLTSAVFCLKKKNTHIYITYNAT